MNFAKMFAHTALSKRRVGTFFVPTQTAAGNNVTGYFFIEKVASVSGM